jgi:membrane protein
VKTITIVFKELLRRYKDHQLELTGSSLAYFFLLALFPFLIFLNALLSFFGFAIQDILISIAPLLPNSTFEILELYLESISAYDNTVLLSFGILGTIFPASIAVTALMKAIFRAYNQKNHRSWLATQGLFVLFTLLIGISLILSLLLPMLGQGFLDFIGQYFIVPNTLSVFWHFFRWIVATLFMMGTLAAIYKVVPYTPYKQSIWPGTIFAVVSWFSISILVSFYFNQFANLSFVYGSIGAVIALMIWLYFTGIIIILGAELNDIIDHL